MTVEANEDPETATVRGRTLAAVAMPEFAPLLDADADEPLAWPGLAVVKESTVRSVLSGTVGGIAVHLKLYRAVRLSDRARDALSGARGVQEFEALREARRRGLPCVEPLAAGRWTGTFGARSFLVTRTVPGAEPLARGPLDVDTAARAGRLLRRTHDAGLQALDLHPANIVAERSGALWLLDLTGATFGEPLQNAARARALAFFCLDLDGNVRDGAARPLIAAYGAPQHVVEAAVRHGRRLRNRALSAFGRRATRACRHTEVRQREGVTWFLHRPAEALHERALAWRPAAAAPLKSGRRGAVWLAAELAVKRREAAAARRLFRAAYWLEFAGVTIPRPVALAVGRGLGHVFFERIPAPHVGEELEHGRLAGAALAQAARGLGRDFGRLHALGLRNRDPKLENLVREPTSGRVAFVDLDGVRRKAPCDRRGEGADLGRLLAAWRARGHPEENAVIRAFWRGYARARRRLLRPADRWLRRTAGVRTQQWFARHETARHS